MYKQNNEELAFSYGVVVPNHVHDCIPIRLQVTNPYWDIARRALWSYEVMEMYVERKQGKRESKSSDENMIDSYCCFEQRQPLCMPSPRYESIARCNDCNAAVLARF